MNDYKEIFREELGHQGSFPECYAFSIHKSGSTLMNKMINQVCIRAAIPGFSIADIMFQNGIPQLEWAEDEQIIELIGFGRIYYGFRFFPKLLMNELVNLREKKAVLLVRDPRDALVSRFFSAGGKHVSHVLPKNKENFLAMVQKTAHMDIDEYVIHSSGYYKNQLSAYKENLNFDNVLLFKYEDIFFGKRKFLGDIFNHFKIDIDSKILDDVALENDIRPESEDISKHIRRGFPGDHVNKLKPETIRKLNNILRDICAWYGYDLQP